MAACRWWVSDGSFSAFALSKPESSVNTMDAIVAIQEHLAIKYSWPRTKSLIVISECFLEPKRFEKMFHASNSCLRKSAGAYSCSLLLVSLALASLALSSTRPKRLKQRPRWPKCLAVCSSNRQHIPKSASALEYLGDATPNLTNTQTRKTFHKQSEGENA